MCRRNHSPVVTSGSSFSSVFGPMPFTRSRSSARRNGPCWSRYSMIRVAIAGPIRGSSSSSDCDAVLMLMRRTRLAGPDGDDGFVGVALGVDGEVPVDDVTRGASTFGSCVADAGLLVGSTSRRAGASEAGVGSASNGELGAGGPRGSTTTTGTVLGVLTGGRTDGSSITTFDSGEGALDVSTAVVTNAAFAGADVLSPTCPGVLERNAATVAPRASVTSAPTPAHLTGPATTPGVTVVASPPIRAVYMLDQPHARAEHLMNASPCLL